jgi:uncharacterized protein YndB with AHSA1/START domain
VVRLEAPRLFQHTFWLELNPSALVTWELTPIEEGTRLDLTHELDLADVRAVAGRESIVTILSRNAAGWHQLLDRVTALVDGTDRSWSQSAHQDLQQRYSAKVG